MLGNLQFVFDHSVNNIPQVTLFSEVVLMTNFFD